MQDMTLDDFLRDFYSEDLEEDTKKIKDHKWTNKGSEGAHGTFTTKKAADAQRKAMFANGYHEDLVTEDIEKHDELNPKLFDGDKLKPEIVDKINEIVDVFIDDLKEDTINIEVEDIILVGSNVSYNYTKDSDLDIHIIANVDNLNCPDNLYPLLYGAYRSLFNKKMDIDFYGIPVEIYVETDDSTLHSNGIYSVMSNDWVRHPEAEEIPDIDTAKIKQLEQPFIDRFNEIEKEPDVEAIDQLITDVYDLRKQGMNEDNAEYSEENLCFKEFRNGGYLDKLKDMRNETLSKNLSLESLSIRESSGRDYLTNSEIYAMRVLLERALHTPVSVFNNGHFTINNIKESDVDYMLRQLHQIDEVLEAHKIASGKYDFAHMDFLKNMPSRYFTINGQLKIE